MWEERKNNSGEWVGLEPKNRIDSDIERCSGCANALLSLLALNNNVESIDKGAQAFPHFLK